VIGTDGFGADTHILGRPGHARRLRALKRLHGGGLWVKPDLLDLGAHVPEVVTSKWPDISAAVRAYGHVIYAAVTVSDNGAAEVVSDLLDPERKKKLDEENRIDQDRLRKLHEERLKTPLLPYRKALENRTAMEWRAEDLAAPPFLGTKSAEPTLAELRDLIDWTFFFTAWELKGRYPQILDHPDHGSAARELFEDGQELLNEIVRDELLTARGVYGFWKAQADGDDIVLDDGLVFHMLRQQVEHGVDDPKPNRSLADFISPAGEGLEDHIGAFAVTTGIGCDELVARFEAENDDYKAIMAKALADRLAEAFAEWLHREVRKQWYAPDESLTGDELNAEKYRGIRPAFGYPACPDHTEKDALFSLLGAREYGLDLTSGYAMTPAAAVSGLYFAHPQSRYFNVGRIGKDQVEEYSRRKGQNRIETERWLRENLAYEPE
jgi:5-methyltetrahydrofolate--homocysteine methyltransferase